jgi:hypothetical protein
MWRRLLPEGTALREVSLESSDRGSEVVIVPTSGERVRVPVAGELDIETSGKVHVRSGARGDTGMRTTFSATERLELACAEVAFDGSEPEWNDMWRRARTRSQPWWRDPSSEEVDLDMAMSVRITLVAR